jgi:hypothetical protein
MSAGVRPRVSRPRNRVVRTGRIPGLGRIAFTRDPGEAELFSKHYLATKLRAIIREPDGRLVEEHDLGSGLVTNVGVLALANDWKVPGVSAAPANLFANLKFGAWGTGSTAAATTNIKLETPAAPNATEATEGIQTVTTNGEGKPKFVLTTKITAESSISITEFGVFTKKKLSSTTGTPLTAKSATSGTVTGTPLTASSTTVLGETLQILFATASENIWGLVTSNTTSVVTVPAWYKESNGTVLEPSATSAFTLRPIMFDRRVFTSIGVESGNTIEFPWELEIKSGG